jgi:hypothetical protein
MKAITAILFWLSNEVLRSAQYVATKNAILVIAE